MVKDKKNLKNVIQKEILLYWIIFIIPFLLLFTILSYRFDYFDLYKKRYPSNFEDQTLFLKLFKNILTLHRSVSIIWSGTLCFQFFTSYSLKIKIKRKIHKIMGWIMTISVLLNILSGLLLMYIKTNNDSKPQNYGFLIAALYSFISQLILIINIVINPKYYYHKQSAIRLIVAPLSAVFQHILYFFFVQCKFNVSSSRLFWDISLISSGIISFIPFEYYLWKKKYK
jgi:hypothetical protein